jgi:hypothetical protein
MIAPSSHHELHRKHFESGKIINGDGIYPYSLNIAEGFESPRKEIPYMVGLVIIVSYIQMNLRIETFRDKLHSALSRPEGINFLNFPCPGSLGFT